MTAALECPPLHHHVPDHVGSYGDEVVDLGETAGLFLDAEQRLLIDAMYAHDAKGRFVASEVGCAAPRQNLKSRVGLVAALADLVLFEDPLCLWTAHLRDTSDTTFAELVDVFTNYDHLRRLVDGKPKDSDGEQSITLRRPRVGAPAPQLAFMARSERGGRGLSGNRVTFDEALFLKPSMLAAMVPVLSARSLAGDVQVRYLGSAGLASSASWREVRDQGRAGTAKKLAWLEWAAPHEACDSDECSHLPGVDGCALDRPHLIAAANLALGRRIDLGFVLGVERLRLQPPVEFMRERLGWWDEPAVADLPAIDPTAWGALVDPEPPAEGRCSWGLAVAPDRSWSALAVAYKRPDGAAQVLLVDYRLGTSWVRAKLEASLKLRPGLVHADVAGRGLFPGAEQPSTTLQAEAHAGLADAVAAGESVLRTDDKPAVVTALRAARWRPQGDSRVLDRKGDIDISPLAAMALALHGLPRRPPPPLPITDAPGLGSGASETAFLSDVAF